MQEGEVSKISDLIKKSIYKELQDYGEKYIQCMGSNLEFTLIISILDCLLANNLQSQTQILTLPEKLYSNHSQQIVEKIKTFIQQERRLSKFYQDVWSSNAQFMGDFLKEFCRIYDQPLKESLLSKLITLNKVFQISFHIFGDQFMKVENTIFFIQINDNVQKVEHKKLWIQIYYKDQKYHYIKQYKELPPIRILSQCTKCRQPLYQNEQCQSNICNNFDQENNNAQISKLRVEEQKNDNKKIYLLKQSDQKDIVQDESQICMNCHKRSQTALFLNQPCKHLFCAKCLANLNDKYQCLNKACVSLIDLVSYFFYEYYFKSYYQDKKQIVVQTQCKNCNCCGINREETKYFLNSCQHAFCKECSIRYAKSTQKQISCSYFSCNHEINHSALFLYLEQQNILFGCSKCQVQKNRKKLYLNNNCNHFLCFDCSSKWITKRNNKQTYLHLCPVEKCEEELNNNNFNQFFQLNQFIKANKTIKQSIQGKQQDICSNGKIVQSDQTSQSFMQMQQPEQQVINHGTQIQKPIIQVNHNQNIIQIKEIRMNEEEENTFKTYEKCSLCFTDFSTYNNQQKLDCPIHQIGVCCFVKNVKCPQCAKLNEKIPQFQHKRKNNQQIATLKFEKINNKDGQDQKD